MVYRCSELQKWVSKYRKIINPRNLFLLFYIVQRENAYIFYFNEKLKYKMGAKCPESLVLYICLCTDIHLYFYALILCIYFIKFKHHVYCLMSMQFFTKTLLIVNTVRNLFYAHSLIVI